eukprot:3092684-Rhodomonas_salina.2
MLPTLPPHDVQSDVGCDDEREQVVHQPDLETGVEEGGEEGAREEGGGRREEGERRERDKPGKQCRSGRVERQKQGQQCGETKTTTGCKLARKRGMSEYTQRQRVRRTDGWRDQAMDLEKLENSLLASIHPSLHPSLVPTAIAQIRLQASSLFSAVTSLSSRSFALFLLSRLLAPHSNPQETSATTTTKKHLPAVDSNTLRGAVSKFEVLFHAREGGQQVSGGRAAGGFVREGHCVVSAEKGILAVRSNGKIKFSRTICSGIVVLKKDHVLISRHSSSTVGHTSISMESGYSKKAKD